MKLWAFIEGNFGYCPRASFPRRETGKVVWVPSFGHFQIRINTGFRNVFVWWMFPHFLDKKVTRMCPKYLLTRYYKRSSQYQTLISNSYTMACPPVRGDNTRALASGLSYVQVDKHGITILYHLHQCRPCTSSDMSC